MVEGEKDLGDAINEVLLENEVMPSSSSSSACSNFKFSRRAFRRVKSGSTATNQPVLHIVLRDIHTFDLS